MIVKVNYRKPKRKSPIKWMVFTFCGMFLGIMAFSFSSEDDFLYLYNLNNQVLQKTKVYQLVSNQYEDWGGDEDQMPAYNTGGTTTATSGAGLNLLLINNIQTEGYVKEYLTIAAENQEGKLDTTGRAAYASVETTLAVNVSESKTYSNLGVLPTSDLPEESKGVPKWDGGTYSLKTWNVNDHNREGYSALGGPLQYTPGKGKYTGVRTTSVYNKGTSTPNGVGDCYLFGDAVAGLNDYLQAGCSTISVDPAQISPESSALITVIAHNRGEGGLCTIFGVGYAKYSSASNYLDYDAIPAEEKESYLKEVHDAASATYNCDDIVDVQNKIFLTAGWSIQSFPFIANGWLFSSDAAAFAKENVKMYSPENHIAAWNALFPDEQVSDTNGLCAAIDRHTSKLSTALGISDSECDKIYGTVNGEYQTWSGFSKKRGDIFCVTDHASNIYKNKPGAKVVYNLETITAAHVYNGVAMAGYVYARMLQYAGVNVDPTNPDTYMNKFSGDGWSSVSTEYQDVLKANGLDTSKLTDERAKIVNVAASYLGTKYLQCRNGGGPDGALCDGFCYNNMDAKATHLDCSAFIWRCYKEAGFDCTGFPTNTGGYTTNDGVLVETTVDQLKPGDVIWFSHGHVELYLGQDDSTIYYIHESTWGVGCVYGTHRKEGFPSKGCKLYRYTRFENE